MLWWMLDKELRRKLSDSVMWFDITCLAVQQDWNDACCPGPEASSTRGVRDRFSALFSNFYLNTGARHICRNFVFYHLIVYTLDKIRKKDFTHFSASSSETVKPWLWLDTDCSETIPLCLVSLYSLFLFPRYNTGITIELFPWLQSCITMQ